MRLSKLLAFTELFRLIFDYLFFNLYYNKNTSPSLSSSFIWTGIYANFYVLSSFLGAAFLFLAKKLEKMVYKTGSSLLILVLLSADIF